MNIGPQDGAPRSEAGSEQSDRDQHPSTSPARQIPNERPRKKRKALACFDCKRRKLKCDREYPACSRCLRGGYPKSCVYEDVPGGDNDEDHPNGQLNGTRLSMNLQQTGHDGVPHDRSPNRHAPSAQNDELLSALTQQSVLIASLQRQLAQLETKVNVSHAQLPSVLPFAAVDGPRVDGPESNLEQTEPDPAKVESQIPGTMLRGKGYSTRFYGASDTVTLLSQVGYPTPRIDASCQSWVFN